MKLNINHLKRDILYGCILISAGILLGWLVFGNGSKPAAQESTIKPKEESAPVIWTCSMHPQIKQDHEGLCPICGMDLIPLETEDEQDIPYQLTMSEAAMKIAEVQTTLVERKQAVKEIFFQGKVKADERKTISQTAHISGRIEKLYVSFTGEKVQKGEKLISIYSPPLITAQEELLEASKYADSNPALLESARKKLKLWKLTDEQINDIEKSGKIQNEFDLLADYEGIVIKKMISLGDHVKEGQVLFHIANLESIWVMFDAYEGDIPWINNNDEIRFEIRSLPGKIFIGRVVFIDPVVNPVTRVAYIRTELNNPGELLKPGMFASGVLNATLPGNKMQLVVPKSAVLWTGKRAIVYIKIPEKEAPLFEYRQIILGEDGGNYYVVKAGLDEGEEIVTNGLFKIDAAAQLQGKASMMNPMNVDDIKKQPSPSLPEIPDVNVLNEKVDPEFVSQLKHVFSKYLEMKTAFVSSNAEEVSNSVSIVTKALESVDMGLLTGDNHHKWMDLEGKLKKQLKKMKGSSEIEEQRTHFSEFITVFYTSLKYFNVGNGEIYYQYCPMAFDNKGGYWLNDTKDIKNPYFGDMMLKCGETVSRF